MPNQLDFQRPLNQTEFEDVFQRGAYGQAEEFPGRGGTRPIQKFTEWLPWVRISGRAHISGLNTSTWNMFQKAILSMERHNALVRKGEKRGRYHFVWEKGKKLPHEEGQLMPNYQRGNLLPRLKFKKAEPFNIMKEAEAYGRGLEDMTGRARLGPLKSLGPTLNAMFFSLRLNIGRLLTPTHLFRGTSRSRKEAWKNVMSSLAVFSGTILLGKQLGLWEVEMDSRRADFMKIRIGKLRIDPWGGYQQFVTFISRMLPSIAGGATKSSITGEIRPPNRIMTTGRLTRSKFSPGAALIWDHVDGKTFTGEKIDYKDVDQWMDRTLQFSVNDIREAYIEEGFKGIAQASPGIFGAGILIYDLPRWPELDEYYQIKAEDVELTPAELRRGIKPISTSTKRSRYRQANAEADVRLFVRGDVTTLKSSQSVSLSERKEMVRTIMRENRVNEKDVPGWEKVFKGETLDPAVPSESRRRNGATPTRVSPPAQAPAPATWRTISQMMDRDTRVALADLWLPKGNLPSQPLTNEQKDKLRPIFERYPMGSNNFEAWYSQELQLLFQQSKPR